MNPLNWSEESKKAEKPSKFFTPNIYRKPIVADEVEKEAKKDVSSAVPQNYVPGKNQNPVQERHEPVYGVPGSDIEDLLQKESLLSEIKQRYESEISEYKEKQKELDELKSNFSDQEKELQNKCAIMKSAIQRSKRSMSSEQMEELEKEIAAFEQKRSEFENQIKEFEDSRLEYETKFAEYSSKMEELSSLRSTYEADFEQYRQKKSELDEMCRSLEEKLSAGEEISIELVDTKYPVAIEIIKSGYYAELKELNRKRADIETRRCQLEDEEIFLNEKLSSLGQIKERIHAELLELGPKTDELEISIAKYEESVNFHKEKELAFQEEVKVLEEKKAELEAETENLRLRYEESVNAHRENELAFQGEVRAFEEKKAGLEADDENLRLRREENARLEESMEKSLVEMEAKRKELEEMVEKTNREIGNHVTIHRQSLDIKKLNNKLEQQAIYIQSLETSVSDLKRCLEEARSDVKKNEVFSQILKQNLELLG
ncbi:hypothetical protein [Methanolobus psychrotolerans]|uniref:hypothetical protein n=1 Tax=Methanolobus psychrotolerans TaxID=1874706 RepID=UPI000B91BD4B|nr:hypothetical protein [Methanolobus psychrotolerans]